MSEVRREIIIRVDAPPTESDPDQQVTHFYSLEALARMIYRWGRHDERSTARGLELFGTGKGWTVGGVSLDYLRDDTSSPQRDGQ